MSCKTTSTIKNNAQWWFCSQLSLMPTLHITTYQITCKCILFQKESQYQVFKVSYISTLRAVLWTKILDKLNSPKSLQTICRKALPVRLFQKKERVDVATFDLSFRAEMPHLKFRARPDNVNMRVAEKRGKCDVYVHVSRKNTCHLSSLLRVFPFCRERATAAEPGDRLRWFGLESFQGAR